MITGQASVTDSSALAVTPLGKGHVYFRNQGANTCYIGPSGVTTANGFPLAINEGVELQLDTGEVVHAVCASAETATLAWAFTDID
jgi:hypothetical protein